jgi:glycosyltransferase involved in cell wall biosynthesis
VGLLSMHSSSCGQLREVHIYFIFSISRPLAAGKCIISMKKVTVIIPARNEERHISKCIRAILTNDYPNYEVIVVDDASTDQTLSVARSFQNIAPVRVIANPNKVGQGESANIGVKASDADFVFFTGADCTPDSKWISEGMKTIDQPGICAVEGALFYENPFPTFRHRVPLNPFYNLHQQGSLTVPGRDYANGNFAVKRAAFEEVHGFDSKRYAEGREDTNLGFRLLKKDKILYNPEMKVTHKENFWSLQSLLSNALRYRADVLFYKDHGFFFFMRGRFIHSKFLLMLLFPLLILVDFRLKSIADFMFVPQFYLYLVVLRLVIWKGAIQEKVFVL